MILYFSGTGNNLAVARAIAEHTGESVQPLHNALNINLLQEKRIGFVYPCYNGDVPKVVPHWIEQLNLPQQAYYFIVIASGLQAGNAIWSVEQVLNKKGIQLNYCHKIRVPDNSALAFGRNPNDQQWKFQRFASRLEQIKKDIASEKNARHYGWRDPLASLMKLFDKTVFNALQPAVNAQKCIGCGICAKVCAVQNIALVTDEAGKKIAQHGQHCEFCLACVHFCPQQAVELSHKPTQKDFQYHHPDVMLKDLIVTNDKMK